MNEQDKKDYEEYQQYIEYLKSKGVQAPAAQMPSDLNLVEKGLVAAEPILIPVGKILDVATGGAPIRAGVAKILEAQTGKEVAPEKKLLAGEAPGFAEMWESQGVPSGPSLSEMVPGAFSETGAGLPLKKGGMFDVTPRGVAGGLVDIATGSLAAPLVAAAKGTQAVGKLSKMLPSMPSKYSIMGTLSGVPSEAIETYAKNKKLISQLDPIKAAELAEQATNDARKAVTGMRQKLGQTLQKTMEDAGTKTADIRSFKDKLYKKVIGSIGDLENIQNQQTAKALKSELDSMFQLKRPQTMMGPMGENIPTGKIETVDIPFQLKATELFDLKNQLKDLGDLYGGRPGIVSKQAAAKIPVSDKRLQTSLLDAVKELDSKIDEVTEGASKEARATYAEQAKKARAIDRYFSTPEKTVGTLSNLSSTAKGPSRKALQEADQLFGTNLEQTGKVFESAKYFNEPSMEALSGKGVTSTSRTLGGSAVGGYIGSLIGGPGGAGLGAVIGSKAASPWMIKNVYLPATEAASAVTPSFKTVMEAQKVLPPQMWLKLLEQIKQGEQK